MLLILLFYVKVFKKARTHQTPFQRDYVCKSENPDSRFVLLGKGGPTKKWEVNVGKGFGKNK